MKQAVIAAHEAASEVPKNIVTIRSGHNSISQLDNGQLCVFDGVRGTFLTDKQFETLCKEILEHRWILK